MAAPSGLRAPRVACCGDQSAKCSFYNLAHCGGKGGNRLPAPREMVVRLPFRCLLLTCLAALGCHSLGKEKHSQAAQPTEPHQDRVSADKIRLQQSEGVGILSNASWSVDRSHLLQMAWGFGFFFFLRQISDPSPPPYSQIYPPPTSFIEI